MIFKASYFSFVFFVMALSVGVSFGASQKIGQTYNLSHGKLSVSAKLVEMMELPDDPPFYTFIIIVEDQNHRYEIKSDIISVDNFTEALGVLKNSIHLQDGYTFIRNECGGGNAWRCELDSIFKINKGLIQWVGDIAGTEERGRVGHNYSGGMFMDYYDKFESNYLTSHAAAPFLKIYSRDVKGGLRVDLEVTWKKNIEIYKKAKEISDRLLLGTALSDNEYRELWSALLQEAVMAKYCERTIEFNEALQTADRVLSEEITKEFHSIVKNVIPGELPKTRVQKQR